MENTCNQQKYVDFTNNEYISHLKEAVTKESLKKGRPLYAYVRSFGCQQNVSDGEKYLAVLTAAGYKVCDSTDEADFILYNSCAVREHAERRLISNIGHLKHVKERDKDAIIAVCGCMTQQEDRFNEIKNTYRHVDICFGTHSVADFPRFVYEALTTRRRVLVNVDSEGFIVEGTGAYRDSSYKAWVPIAYGCNNFCSYCIVPYVRGRERSRKPEDILREVEALVRDGYKDITLLGQNVNSYGKDLEVPMPFYELLNNCASFDGDYLVRFMTSHPKDAGPELFSVMAENKNVAKHLHLPFQSGNDRILAQMNRKYDRAHYLSLIRQAKSMMPSLTLSSDVIVGFPNETEQEFEDTLSLVSEVRFDLLYSFIYSKRTGTPAAKMEDCVSIAEKTERLTRLNALQEQISKEINSDFTGRTVRVLCEGVSKTDPEFLSGRTEGGKLVHYKGDPAMEGLYEYVRITRSGSFSFMGERAD